ncbi:MAG: D-sedoheptulose 7-phosphate isomerase [Bdellovibrionota bacterium]
MSHELEESTPAYGNGEGFLVLEKKEMGGQASSRKQIWKFNNHVGTHMDFPAHFDEEGKNLSQYKADDFFFEKVAFVEAPVSADHLILPQDLKLGSESKNAELLLIKTGFEARRKTDGYVLHGPGLHPETCQWLRTTMPNLRAIGFDFISLTAYQHREAGREAHRVLLKKQGAKDGIWIIEDMKLSPMKSSPAHVLVAPLQVNVEGAVMDTTAVWKKSFESAASVLKAFMEDPALIARCVEFSKLLTETFRNEKNVFTCGNGGSHCDAMHFAEEWTGRYKKDRRALGALALGESSHLTCVANDFGFEHIFSRQLDGLGKKGDLLIGISTSGNSMNVINAIEVAKKKGIRTVGLLGKDGGKMKALVDLPIIVPAQTAERIQELHIKVIHTVIESVERELFPELYTEAK